MIHKVVVGWSSTDNQGCIFYDRIYCIKVLGTHWSWRTRDGLAWLCLCLSGGWKPLIGVRCSLWVQLGLDLMVPEIPVLGRCCSFRDGWVETWCCCHTFLPSSQLGIPPGIVIPTDRQKHYRIASTQSRYLLAMRRTSSTRLRTQPGDHCYSMKYTVE